MIIVDTSVALKWFRTKDEKFIEQALALIRNHLTNQETISVPQLFYLEIANALTTKTDTDSRQIAIDLKKLYNMELKVIEATKSEVISAAKLAKKYNTSDYDMLYAVVAKTNNCILITADENFVKKTGFKFVKHISQV